MAAMRERMNFGRDNGITEHVNGLAVFLWRYLRRQYIQLLNNRCIIMLIGLPASSFDPDMFSLFVYV
jgi:hypothetical protein